jgi:hypothetical protein
MSIISITSLAFFVQLTVKKVDRFFRHSKFSTVFLYGELVMIVAWKMFRGFRSIPQIKLVGHQNYSQMNQHDFARCLVVVLLKYCIKWTVVSFFTTVAD